MFKRPFLGTPLVPLKVIIRDSSGANQVVCTRESHTGLHSFVASSVVMSLFHKDFNVCVCHEHFGNACRLAMETSKLELVNSTIIGPRIEIQCCLFEAWDRGGFKPVVRSHLVLAVASSPFCLVMVAWGGVPWIASYPQLYIHAERPCDRAVPNDSSSSDAWLVKWDGPTLLRCHVFSRVFASKGSIGKWMHTWVQHSFPEVPTCSVSCDFNQSHVPARSRISLNCPRFWLGAVQLHCRQFPTLPTLFKRIQA